MRLYRATDPKTNGWLLDEGRKAWAPDPDEWRPATRAERAWFFLFQDSLSFVQYAALTTIALAVYSMHDDLLWTVIWLIVLSLSGTFIVAFLKVFTEPGQWSRDD